MAISENVLGSDDRMMIKKKGYFDFNKLYANIYKWFQDKKYEFTETDHKYKANNPLGEEHEIFVYAWRKEDDYLKWEIYLYIMIWDLIPVTITLENGQKKKLHQGRIKIWIVPKFVFDWENRFENTPFLRKIGKFYMMNIKRRLWQVQGDKFEYEFHELHDLIKKDLDMYNAGNQFAHMWK